MSTAPTPAAVVTRNATDDAPSANGSPSTRSHRAASRPANSGRPAAHGSTPGPNRRTSRSVNPG
ncbi:MAG TPA: hypothetical protein VFW65_27410 [Pseudonocardiaceae bacterium]|nr:hypothetical protein [Pseudonocardiaceae bacterium]